MIEYLNLKIDINENETFLLEGESSCINNFEKYCKGKDFNIIIDIGANVGCFSLVTTVLANVNQIIAIEANSLNYDRLCNNIFGNNLWGKIVPLPYAVYSKSNELLQLYSATNGNSGQSSLLFTENFSKINLSRTISLIDLCRNYPLIDYIKIDIEGGEYDVLYPSEDVMEVLKKVKMLEIEFHPLSNRDYYNPDNFLKNHSSYSNIDDVQKNSLKFIEDCGHEIFEDNGAFLTRNKNFI